MLVGSFCMDKLVYELISNFETWLFDLDGTLIDSKTSNYLAYKDALAELNMKLNEEDFAKYWGQDSGYFLPKLFPNISNIELQKTRQSKPIFFQNYLSEIRVNDELINLIKQNFTKQKIGLVTTAKSESIQAVFNFLKIDKYFSVVVSGDSPVSPKPSPEPYLYALEKLNSLPKNAVAFEDSDTGINSATSAGIEVIRINFNSVNT